MDIVSSLMHGFAVLLSPLVLTACIVGLIAGIVAGFLPGLSPAGAIALQISFLGTVAATFGLQSPIVFIVAFAFGTLYGRALAAMNLNAADQADSGPYAKTQRPVLLAGLIAGVIAAIGVGVLIIPGRLLTLQLGPTEMAALIMFMLLGGAAFGRGSVASALAVIVLGLLFRLVGTDLETGIPRLTFGITALDDGIGLITVALGLFVIADAIDEMVRAAQRNQNAAFVTDSAALAFLPSAIFAALSGFLPTNGGTYADTASAARARALPDLFDPASQRGAGAIIRAAMLSDIRLSISLIPLFLLLAPVDAVTAILRNIVQFQARIMGGNDAIANLASIGWLVCATLFLAHLVPLIFLVRFAAARWRPIPLDVRIIAALLIAACCLALWLLHSAPITPIVIMFVFGLIGYAMIRCDFDRSLMFFAFAVGATFEENIRRSLLISRGDVMVYLNRPLAAAFLIAGVALLVVGRAGRQWSATRTRIATAG